MVTVRRLSQADVGNVLELLNETFGPGHTRAWFRWKHESHPAGPSLGLVAEDEDGLAGVRLVMPWPLTVDGQRVAGARPLDTATAARARGQGLFRLLTEHAVDELRSDGVALLANTPNTQSLPGYTKFGWTPLPAIQHVYSVVRRRGRPALSECEIADLPDVDGTAVYTTDRSARYLSWRYGSAAPLVYRARSLVHAESPAFVVYRITQAKGLRVMVVEEAVGNPSARAAVVEGAARAERTSVLLHASGPGAMPSLDSRLAVRRGSSVLAIRRLRNDALPTDPTSRSAWGLSLGDLSGLL